MSFRINPNNIDTDSAVIADLLVNNIEIRGTIIGIDLTGPTGPYRNYRPYRFHWINRANWCCDIHISFPIRI
jgi:hypothetical protein